MYSRRCSIGFLTANGIVGAGVGIAGGAALWHKLTGSGRVVVSFFGDGAANHGYFLESLNLASLWALPLLLVCENNGYAISTPTRAALAGQGVLARTSAFGIPGESVDGTNVLEVMQAAERAVKRIREGAGPWLIECRTLRLRGHYEGDPQHYRPEEEIATVAASDSLSRFELELRSEWGWTDEDEHRLRSEILAAIEEAQAFAEASPFPLTDEMEEFLYPGGDQGEKN